MKWLPLFKYFDKSPPFVPREKQSNGITWALHPIFKHLRKTREIQKIQDMKPRDIQIPTFPETCCDNEQFPYKMTPQHTTDQQFTSQKSTTPHKTTIHTTIHSWRHTERLRFPASSLWRWIVHLRQGFFFFFCELLLDLTFGFHQWLKRPLTCTY